MYNIYCFISRQLCLLISSEDIFQSLSEILVSEIDVKFACLMVQTLNTILLTSTELYELRNQLKDLATQVTGLALVPNIISALEVSIVCLQNFS